MSWENNIKRHFKEISYKDDKWVQIADSITQWRAYVLKYRVLLIESVNNWSYVYLEFEANISMSYKGSR
jgi:hypothetical protein